MLQDQLREASKEGNIEAVRYLLTQDVPVDCTYEVSIIIHYTLHEVLCMGLLLSGSLCTCDGATIHSILVVAGSYCVNVVLAIASS